MSALSLSLEGTPACPRPAPTRPTLLRLWLRRLAARRSLMELDPEQIREAGLDPYRVRAQRLKPFWRA